MNDTYRLMWFSKDNYRAYYDAQGELEESRADLLVQCALRPWPLAMPEQDDEPALREAVGQA